MGYQWGVEPLFAPPVDQPPRGVVVVAAQDARQTPEGIGSDSQLRTMAFSLVERQIVFITHVTSVLPVRERNAAPRSSRPARPRLVSLWRMLCGRELRPGCTKLEQLLDQGVPVDKGSLGQVQLQVRKKKRVYCPSTKNGVAYATP